MKIKVNFFKPKENFWLGLSQIVFRISFILVIFLFVMEYIFPGFVTSWFNPIWVLIITIISGIISTIDD